MEQTVKTIEAHAEVLLEDTEVPEVQGEWHTLRRQGIGGSDAAAAAGLSPWKSPYALFAEKAFGLGHGDENDRMRWGKRLERAIGYGIAEDVGLEVAPYKKMLRSRTFPIAQVNLDLISPRSIVEVKNTGARMGEEWDDGAVPDHYALQGMHELLVTGMAEIDFMCLIDGGEARHVHMERDEALIADLQNIEEAFWKLVEANTPPSVDASASTTDALKRRYARPEPGSAVVLPMTVLERIGDHRNLKAAIKKAEGEVKQIENELREMLGDHERGLVDGIEVVTYKLQEREGYVVQPTAFRKFHFPTATKKGKK